MARRSLSLSSCGDDELTDERRWGGYAAGEIGSELWPTNEVHERFKVRGLPCSQVLAKLIKEQDELREEVLRLGEVIAKKMGLP